MGSEMKKEPKGVRVMLALLVFCTAIYFAAHMLSDAYGAMMYTALMIGLFFVANGLFDIFTIYKISKSPSLNLTSIKFQFVENYRFSRIGPILYYSIRASGIYADGQVDISFKFACDNSFDEKKELNKFVESCRDDGRVVIHKGGCYFKYFPISRQHALVKIIVSALSVAFILMVYKIQEIN